MTVKEATETITEVKKFHIARDGAMQSSISDDEIVPRACDGFVVKTIDFAVESGSKSHVEIAIAVRPVVEGEAVE